MKQAKPLLHCGRPDKVSLAPLCMHAPVLAVQPGEADMENKVREPNVNDVGGAGRRVLRTRLSAAALQGADEGARVVKSGEARGGEGRGAWLLRARP